MECRDEGRVEEWLNAAVNQGLHSLEIALLDLLDLYAEDTSISEKKMVQWITSTTEKAEKAPWKSDPDASNAISWMDLLVLADCHARCLDKKEQDGSRSRRVIGLLSPLRELNLISPSLIADRFSHELDAFALGLRLKDAAARNMYVRINTRANLVQVRYNTLREEADGFNKLMLLLAPPFLLRYPDILASRILAITGAFELDSYRVLDLILDCLEHVPSQVLDTDKDVAQLFIHLLRHHGNSHSVLSLIAFKFSSYSVNALPIDATALSNGVATDSPTQSAGEAQAAPRGLFTLAALLIKAGIISMEALLPYLSPTDESMFSQTTELQQKADDAVQKASKKALDEAKTSTQENSFDFNQKLRLLEALLRVDDWDRAAILLQLWSKSQPSRFPSIAKMVCRHLSSILDPIYKPFSPRSFITQGARAPAPSEEVIVTLRAQVIIPILEHLGAYIAYDPPMLYKFVRTLASLTPRARDGSFAPGPLDDLIEDVAVKVLLPAVSLVPLSPVASCEVWSLLRCYKYPLRYRIYFMSRQTSNVGIEVNIRRASQIQDIRAILRRVTMDRVKEDGRKIGRLALSTPGVVFHQVLQQLQSYSNFIEPMADALKFLTPLGADILAFLLMEALSRPEDLVKSDGQNSSQWLSGLAAFCGGFYRRYGFRTDLDPVLVYVQNQLRRNSPWHLLILKELLSKMANVDVQEEAYDDDLVGLNSAPALRDLVRQEGVMQQGGPSSRSAIHSLAQTLRDSKLALNLFSLIVQVRKAAAYALETEDRLRVVADLTDRCHQVLLQYSDFLKRFVLVPQSQESARRLASWFPADIFTVLCGGDPSLHCPNAIPLNFAFHLTRPLLPILFADISGGGQYFADSELEHFRKECAKIMYPGTLAEVVSAHVPPGAPFSSGFMSRFWALSLYDIHASPEAYSKRKPNITAEDPLAKQRDTHLKHVSSCVESLKSEMKSWFTLPEPELAVVTHCILPRLRMSAEDALYAGYFVSLLNKLQVPGWSAVRFLRAFFRVLRVALAGSTENEEHRLGRTVRVLWSDVVAFKSSPDSFEASPIKQSSNLSYSEFRSETLTWEEHIRSVLVRLLLSSEKTDARNSLLLLSRISSVFPTYSHVLALLSPRLEKMATSTDEGKKDLALLATNILRLLRERTGLMTDDVFVADRPSVSAHVQPLNDNENADYPADLSNPAEDEHIAEDEEPRESRKRPRDDADDDSKRQDENDGSNEERPPKMAKLEGGPELDLMEDS
jgi:THO complex subunit 2